MASLMVVLGVYFVVAGALIYIMIMGPTKFHRDGIVGALQRRLQTLPSQLGYGTCLLVQCGDKKRAAERWAAAEQRIMYKRHPTLMIFYLALMACCYTLMGMYVYPRLPVDSITRPTVIWASVLAILIYFTACFKDPGIVKSKKQRATMSDVQLRIEDRKNARYSGDGILFPSNDLREDCRTCEVPKVARSKHCRVCGHCVRRYDHHCGWLNADVGEGNILWFHLFLVWHVILSMYYAMLCYIVIMLWISSERLWSASFVSRDGRRHQATLQVILMFALGEHTAVVALGFFALMVAVMLFVFWLTHLRNALRNQTSNEVYKLEEYTSIVNYEYEASKKRQQRRERLKAEGKTEADDEGDAEVKGGMVPRENMTKEMVKEELHRAAHAFDRGSVIVNLFDTFGWIAKQPDTSAAGKAASRADARRGGASSRKAAKKE